MRTYLIATVIAAWLPFSFADAPVVDAYSQGMAAPIAQQQFVQRDDVVDEDDDSPVAATPSVDVAAHPAPSLSTQSQLQLSTRLDQLEQLVQTLQGQLEVQSHTLAQLQQQLKSGEHGDVTAAPSVATTTPTTQQTQDAQAELKAQMVYQAAYDEIRARNYAQAMQDLQAFTTTYPHSRLVPNAEYWMGELYLLRGDSKKAMAKLTKVASEYPQHPKAADALFKVGLIEADQGKWTQAKQMLQQVEQKYPESSAAQLARHRMTELRQQGH